jgi:ribosomal protein S18 acetylase RimI-like enzyme
MQQTGSTTIREIQPSDREWARAFLMEQFGSTRVVTRGVMHEADKLPGFVALYDDVPRALLTYSHRNNELEVVTLHSAMAGLGLGSRLLVAASRLARDRRCRRIWLITTNDNEPAILFYQRRGMRIAAIHHGRDRRITQAQARNWNVWRGRAPHRGRSRVRDGLRIACLKLTNTLRPTKSGGQSCCRQSSHLRGTDALERFGGKMLEIGPIEPSKESLQFGNLTRPETQMADAETKEDSSGDRI